MQRYRCCVVTEFCSSCSNNKPVADVRLTLWCQEAKPSINHSINHSISQSVMMHRLQWLASVLKPRPSSLTTSCLATLTHGVCSHSRRFFTSRQSGIKTCFSSFVFLFFYIKRSVAPHSWCGGGPRSPTELAGEGEADGGESAVAAAKPGPPPLWFRWAERESQRRNDFTNNLTLLSRCMKKK